MVGRMTKASLKDHPGYVVVFGNPSAHALLPHPNARKAEAGERTFQPVETAHPSTIVVMPAGMPLVEALATMTSAQGVVAAHAAGDVDFIACSDPALGQVLAQHYGCEQRELTSELLEAHDPHGALAATFGVKTPAGES